MNLTEFIEDIYRFGMEKFRRLYGPYAAFVINNQDPEGKGRIQVVCARARLGPNNGTWLWPAFPGAGIDKNTQKACGTFWIPSVGSGVWVTYDNGDPTKPLVWWGGWYGGESVSELAVDFAPDSDSNGNPTYNKRGLVTPSGSKVIFNDLQGSESILVQHSNGQQILIDDTGVSIGNMQGTFEPMLRGSTVKNWLINHTHSTPYGPSGPPIEEFPDNGLSTDTKTS